MPRASAEAAGETARRVLATALDLFAADGYAGVSLERVAGAAGVTRGAVYHHYGSKRALFESVAAQVQADVAAAVASAADEVSDGAWVRLRAGSHAFLDAITETSVARILLQDAPAVIGWARWRDLDADHSVAHLREALATVGVPERELEALTVQLSGAMNEAALWLAQHPDDATARVSAHVALDRLLSCVGA